jgi:hypothetical protein
MSDPVGQRWPNGSPGWKTPAAFASGTGKGSSAMIRLPVALICEYLLSQHRQISWSAYPALWYISIVSIQLIHGMCPSGIYAVIP